MIKLEDYELKDSTKTDEIMDDYDGNYYNNLEKDTEEYIENIYKYQRILFISLGIIFLIVTVLFIISFFYV